MSLTPEQKEHAITLIEMGDTLEAVRYFQQTLTISPEQALALVEKLKEEVDPDPLLTEFKLQQAKASAKPGVNVARLVGSIFMCVGLVMLATVTYIIISNHTFIERALPAKGTVVKFDTYQSSNDDGSSTTMYRPTFEYQFEGKVYVYQSSSASSSPEYEVGEVVKALVDPEVPTEILIDSFWERWFISVLLGSMGILFTGIGYLAFRFGK